MATRVALWRLTEAGLASPVPEARLASEEILENAVESAPELLGLDVLIVGRQTLTPSGPLDLLGLDADASLVVIENKRDRTPREVLAQTIDYAAWASTLSFDEVAQIYADYRRKLGLDAADLAEDYEERFGVPLDTLSDAPRMVVVAARLDDATERMIDFLAGSFSVPVNAVLFQPFEGGFVGTTTLRPDDPGSRTSATRSAASTASRDEAQRFWDAWLDHGRNALPEIQLPKSGPRSVLIRRRIIRGLPAALTTWVASSEAYAEVQFDDDDPELNELLLGRLQRRGEEIESSFGGALDWRGSDANELMTKRTKVVTPKVAIGSRSDPTDEGLIGLSDVARRLLDAVTPHLQAVYDEATAARDEAEAIAVESPLDAAEDPHAVVPGDGR